MYHEAIALDLEIERLHPASWAWALACCGYDRAEAEDVLQTSYLKVIDGRARWDGRAQLKSFLFAVIRTTAADQRRSAWLRRSRLVRWLSRQPEAEPVPPPDHGLGDAERRRILAALRALPARQREVLELVFYHDVTVEEAARVMGVALGTARIHYDRGKRRLSERLGARDGR